MSVNRSDAKSYKHCIRNMYVVAKYTGSHTMCAISEKRPVIVVNQMYQLEVT